MSQNYPLDVVQILQELIRIRSYSGEESKLADWIVGWCNAHDVFAELKDGNVTVYLAGTAQPDTPLSRVALIFNGHMDTVDAGELSDWSHPPFGEEAGVIVGDKIFGLGASDMKASLAAFMVLIHHYQQNPPPVDLFFTFVTEEETSGDGTRKFVEYFQKNHRDRYDVVEAVVGEPTDLDYIEIGNRGVFYYELSVSGESCHAAQAADRDTNAPEILLKAVSELQSRLEQWKERYSHELIGLPAVTITGLETADSSPNQVPARAKVRWDIRTTPDLHGKIEEEMKEVVGKFGELKLVTTPCLAAVAPSEAAIIQSIEGAIPGIEKRAARGGNDSGTLIEVGIPAVTLGPGQKAIIHCINEYAEIDKLQQVSALYQKIVQEFSILAVSDDSS